MGMEARGDGGGSTGTHPILRERSCRLRYRISIIFISLPTRYEPFYPGRLTPHLVSYLHMKSELSTDAHARLIVGNSPQKHMACTRGFQ